MKEDRGREAEELEGLEIGSSVVEDEENRDRRRNEFVTEEGD
jgi:hypothetical protein